MLIIFKLLYLTLLLPKYYYNECSKKIIKKAHSTVVFFTLYT